MSSAAGSVVITFAMRPRERAVVTEALGDAARCVFLTDLDDAARTQALREASAVLARDTRQDLKPSEIALLGQAKLVQFMTAGIDFVDFSGYPPGLAVAANGGAYAGPMAEHGLALVLAAAKRLLAEHEALKRGEFNQSTRNRALAGGVCGIVGFGGIGVALARLMRALGMRIHAVNRRGASDEPADWIGPIGQLDDLLRVSDVVVLSLPLTPATEGLLGVRELGLMKPDAILLNLARGEIVDEAALFAHLSSQPSFTACIDAWWVEPARHGSFRTRFPFLSLPNVIGSPHNSASVPGMTEGAIRRAVANIRRALAGETPHSLLGPEERFSRPPHPPA